MGSTEGDSNLDGENLDEYLYDETQDIFSEGDDTSYTPITTPKSSLNMNTKTTTTFSSDQDDSSMPNNSKDLERRKKGKRTLLKRSSSTMSTGSRNSSKMPSKSSTKSLLEDALEEEREMYALLKRREKNRTDRNRELLDEEEERYLEEKIQLSERLNCLIDKAESMGIEASLALNETDDFSQENCFNLGSLLRENEMKVVDARSRISEYNKNIIELDIYYQRMFNPLRGELEQKVSDSEEKLNQEKEKNIYLKERYSKMIKDKRVLKEDATKSKEYLFENLRHLIKRAEKEAEKKEQGKIVKTSHICVSELVRLCIQENDVSHIVSSGTKSKETGTQNQTNQGSNKGKGPVGSAAILRQTQKELDTLEEQNGKLRKALENIEEQMKESKKVGSVIRSMQQKLVKFLDKQTKEKDAAFFVSKEIEEIEKKVEVLSDHIERLMLHLKHEVAGKSKAQENTAHIAREIELLRARNETIAKSNLQKDNVILELQEGGRVLEDQLKLMDERYVELRGKLEEVRTRAKHDLEKSLKKASNIRLKWETESKGALPLEMIPIIKNPDVLRKFGHIFKGSIQPICKVEDSLLQSNQNHERGATLVSTTTR